LNAGNPFFLCAESVKKKIKVEAEGDVHIPDLTGSSSYQDIAAEEEQQEFFTDWAQLLQSKVDDFRNRLRECESLQSRVKSFKHQYNLPVLRSSPKGPQMA
jgi:hypothetical protein